MLQRLRPYLESSPNYCRLQSAYFTGRSSETAHVKIVDDILGHIDGGSVVALVSFDISAPFDMVDHNLVLERLSVKFGITGAARDWIASYLRSRSFFVRIEQSLSSSSNAGVPQGSMLGPILFAVYVSPIGRLIESFGIEYHGYADDTQLCTALKGDMGPGLDKLSQCTIALDYLINNGQ